MPSHADAGEDFDARGSIPDSAMPDHMHHRAHPTANVGATERILATTLGLSLVAFGLTRRGMTRMGAAAAGGALLWHGAKPNSFAYKALGIGADDATPASHPFSRSTQSKVSVTINASPEDLYQRWRDLSQLPRIFPHVESIIERDEGISEWTACLPGERLVSWGTRITTEEPGKRLAWETTKAAPFTHNGSITFEAAPHNRGTRVTLEQRYHLPAGAFGVLLARLVGADPMQEARAALSRFKQLVEAGEIADNASPIARQKSPAAQRRHDRNQQLIEAKRRQHAIDESAKESFPASDPPSFTTTSATSSETTNAD